MLFIFLLTGNWNFDDEESGADDFACNKDKRDEQWLGVSMDGGNNENNKFVVLKAIYSFCQFNIMYNN